MGHYYRWSVIDQWRRGADITAARTHVRRPLPRSRAVTDGWCATFDSVTSLPHRFVVATGFVATVLTCHPSLVIGQLASVPVLNPASEGEMNDGRSGLVPAGLLGRHQHRSAGAIRVLRHLFRIRHLHGASRLPRGQLGSSEHLLFMSTDPGGGPCRLPDSKSINRRVLAYLPSVLLLLATKSFLRHRVDHARSVSRPASSPLIAGRCARSDGNKTLGFGISTRWSTSADLRPRSWPHLRAISWATRSWLPPSRW